MKSVIALHEMDREYSAWQAVVKECRLLDIDMNLQKYDRLIRAICVWGERLHALRTIQRPDQVEAALGSYLNQYEKAKDESGQP